MMQETTMKVRVLNRWSVMAGLAMAAVPAAVWATPVTLLNDTFDSSTIQNSGSYANNYATPSTGNAQGTFWYLGNTGRALLACASDPTIGSGNALYLGQTNAETGGLAGRRLIGFFTPRSLNVGDKITVSLDINFASAPDTGNNLFVGLFNSSGTYQAANTTDNSTRTDDKGYHVAFAAAGATAGSYLYREDNTLDTTDIFAGSSPGRTALGSSFDTASAGTAKHTMTMTIERVSAAQTNVSFAIDGGTAISRTDNSPVTSSFDEVGIYYSPAASYSIDNVSVTYTAVPEPAVIGLLGTSGLLTLRWRRA